MRNPKKIVRVSLIVIGLTVILAVGAYFLFHHLYQASTNIKLNSVTVKGHLYYGLTNATPTNTQPLIPVPNEPVILIDRDGNKFYGTSDPFGNYQVKVDNPDTCAYKAIAGGNKYNAKSAGDINLVAMAQMQGAVSGSDAVISRSVDYFIDNQIDLMYSKYFGTNFPDGYNGAYHLSKWDTHVARNQVTIDKFLSPQAPSTAKITLKLDIKSGSTTPLGYGTNPPAGYSPPKVHGVFTVTPVTNSWDQSNNFSSGSAPSRCITNPTNDMERSLMNSYVACKDVVISDLPLGTSTMTFDVDYKNYNDWNKYVSWVNGFAINSSFYVEGTTAWDSVLNPDLYMPRSEDNLANAAKIEYSGFRPVNTSNTVRPTAFGIPNQGDGDPLRSGLFGMRMHPKYNVMKCHRGIDLSPKGANPSGPIVAYRAGTVTFAGWGGGYGNRVVIDHGDGTSSTYNHMENGSIVVTPGQKVTAGQKLGTMGTTGVSTGNHLHFEIIQNGNYVDPWPFIHCLFPRSVEDAMPSPHAPCNPSSLVAS